MEKDKILETEKFYKDVYSSKTAVSQVDFDECIWDIEIPKLDNEDFYEWTGRAFHFGRM